MTTEYQFKGKLIKVTCEQRRLPNGHTTQLDIVQHPGAVLIVPFLTSRELIFVHQFRPVLNTYLYELPAGTLNSGERPYQCASRELIEETGFSSKKIKRLGRIVPVPGYSTEVITIFKAEGLKPVESANFFLKPSPRTSKRNQKISQVLENKDVDEVIRVCSFSVAQIQSLFRRGRIYDSKTICALCYCGIL